MTKPTLPELILAEQDAILEVVQGDLESIWRTLQEYEWVFMPFLHWDWHLEFLRVALERQGLVTRVDEWTLEIGIDTDSFREERLRYDDEH